MKKTVKRIGLLSAVILSLTLNLSAPALAAADSPQNQNQGRATQRCESYLDIPDITKEQIAAVKALASNRDYLTYGMELSSEAFALADGSIDGFAKAFTDYLSDIFGIEVRLEIYDWDYLYQGILSGEIDLTGELSPTEERRKVLHMTQIPIISTPFYSYRLKSGQSDREVPVYGFAEGSVTEALVANAVNYEFESVYVSDDDEIVSYLRDKKIDAYIDLSIYSYGFERFPDIIGTEFYPVIYTSSSLATANDDVKIIIDLMEKLLSEGNDKYVNELYGQQQEVYHKAMFNQSLTAEERAYLHEMTLSNKAIPVACQPDNYPLSFYNQKENAFQGIALEILEEVSKLSGLNFTIEDNIQGSELGIVTALSAGNVTMTTELLERPEREGHFLWSNAYSSETFELITKIDADDFTINQIPFIKVGVISYFDLVFNKWFGKSNNYTLYRTLDEAIEALDRGDIDAVFGTSNSLITAVNFQERTDLKTNIVFGYDLENKFGFNLEQEILRNIFNKALNHINTDTIDKRWKNKTYDYNLRIAQETLPLYRALIAIVIVSALIVIGLIFRYNRKIHLRNKELQILDDTLHETIRLCHSMVYEYDCVHDHFKVHVADYSSLGVDPNQLTGKLAPVLRYNIHPEDIKELQGMLESFIYGEKQEKFATRMRLKNFNTGEWVWYRNYSMAASRTRSGHVKIITGCLIYIDQTMREAQMYSSRLESERQTMTDLFENNPFPCFMFDDKFNVLNCNDAMIKLFDFKDKEDAMKNTLSVLPGYIVDVQEGGRPSVPISARLFKAFNEGYEHSESILMIHGRRVILSIDYIRISYNDKNALVCYATDITQFRDNIVELQTSYEMIESQKNLLDEQNSGLIAATEAKTVFLSRMSHEIRTPLNAILGMADIGSKSDDPKRIAYSFEKINEAGQHLSGVINDILDISKIEAGKLEIANEIFNPEKAYKRAVDMIGFRIAEKNITFDYDFDKNLPSFVYGDDQRFVQVLINLLSNAVKFTPEGGKISLSGKVEKIEKGYVTLLTTVSDNGIGIAVGNIEKLFDSFVQADNSTSRKFGGTGLGLAISKRIAEMMEGDITVESEKGKGSAFKFSAILALAEKDLETGEQHTRETDEANEPHDLKGLRILAAEDVDINQIVLESMLEDTGIDIEFADNGLIAVEKFKAHPEKYDLILMDMHMPELDGLGATRAIRALEGIENARTVPIIAVTANVFREDIEKCLAAGMNSHLGKPIDRADLIEKLKQYYS